MQAWIQAWAESERGWGIRPDGFTVHREREDIFNFLQEMRAREAIEYQGRVPDEYSYPDGDPVLVEVPADMLDQVPTEGLGKWLSHTIFIKDGRLQRKKAS